MEIMVNNRWFCAVNLIFVFAQITRVNAQGEKCSTPNDYSGNCAILQNCPSLMNYYGQSPNHPEVINFLLISQQKCGTRSVNKEPLVCCTDPVYYRPQPPLIRGPISQIPQPTAQPQPRPQFQPQQQTPTEQPEETPPEVQTFSVPTSSTIPTDGTCSDPNGVVGICKSIKECPVILNEFLARSQDSAYILYLQRSNENCRNIKPFICCPFETRAANPSNYQPNLDIQGRLLSPEEGCGLSKIVNTKIVGGMNAKPGAFPWMALIGYVNSLGDQSFKCGGSLISTRHVLSAAHCVQSTLSFVRLGEHDISSTSDGTVEDIKVFRSERHPNYNKRDGTNDIAILYLERDVGITNRIRPVCLPINEPTLSQNFVSYNPFVAGWGRLQEGGRSSNILQQLQIEVLDNRECREQYRRQGKLVSENQFGDAVICAGNLAGGQDSCQGDSGGPLVLPIFENGKFPVYQIGIVSYGIGCARTNTPGVYTRVQQFVDWIQAKVNQ